MQQVLQWWTKMRLRHTSTFGVRVYRRGSMLIDHVDRMDTHLASAVLQVPFVTDPLNDRSGGHPPRLGRALGATLCGAAAIFRRGSLPERSLSSGLDSFFFFARAKMQAT